MVKGFAHVALYASKYEETIEFYKTVFGAEDIGRFADGKICMLAVGDDYIEVFDRTGDPNGCFKHIAISCDNVDELYAKALANGAKKYIEPGDMTLPLNKPMNIRVAFVKGINGEEIEIFHEK